MIIVCVLRHPPTLYANGGSVGAWLSCQVAPWFGCSVGGVIGLEIRTLGGLVAGSLGGSEAFSVAGRFVAGHITGLQEGFGIFRGALCGIIEGLWGWPLGSPWSFPAGAFV